MGDVIKANISDLTPDPRNANKGTQRGRGMLDQSLRQYGAGRSILLDKHNRIIAGNKTTEAAADIGLNDVVIVESDGTQLVAVKRTDLDLDDNAARELAYADNRVAQVDLDWDAAQMLQDAAAGVDLDKFFLKDELDEMLGRAVAGDSDAEPQIDRAAELNEKWQVKAGDLWRIGEHRLLCGDSTDAGDVALFMGNDKADMIFTDPPYNVAGEGRNYAADAPTQKKTYEALKNADWDRDFDIETAFPSLESAMADDCAVYVCTSQWLVQRIWEWMWSWSKFCSYNVWCKPNPAPSLSKRHWTWATELIAYAVRGSHISNFPESGHALNWWEVVSPSHTTDHPTEKPKEIPERAIRFSSNADQIVADFFAGSGTTLVACQNLQRKCRAIEISPNYCAVILERMATAFPGIEIERLVP